MIGSTASQMAAGRDAQHRRHDDDIAQPVLEQTQHAQNQHQRAAGRQCRGAHQIRPAERRGFDE